MADIYTKDTFQTNTYNRDSSSDESYTYDESTDDYAPSQKAVKTYVDNLNIPTATSDLTNDSGFITSSALSPYALTSNLATVATTGSYNSLSNKPTIPTTTSSVTSGSTAALTSGGAYTNLVRRKSTSTATGSSTQGIYVDANGQIQTCTAVTSTYAATGTAPVNGKAVSNAIATKQDTLVSGTNIKTINNESILGSGNITISSGSDVEAYTASEVETIWDSVVILALSFIKGNMVTSYIIDDITYSDDATILLSEGNHTFKITTSASASGISSTWNNAQTTINQLGSNNTAVLSVTQNMVRINDYQLGPSSSTFTVFASNTTGGASN